MFISENRYTGNYEADAANIIRLENTGNERTYKNAAGTEYTLVDEIIESEEGKEVNTYVMISYDKYNGFISFKNLADSNIHHILDTVKAGE